MGLGFGRLSFHAFPDMCEVLYLLPRRVNAPCFYTYNSRFGRMEIGILGRQRISIYHVGMHGITGELQLSNNRGLSSCSRSCCDQASADSTP